jgi:hypothetical protein
VNLLKNGLLYHYKFKACGYQLQLRQLLHIVSQAATVKIVEVTFAVIVPSYTPAQSI